MRILKGVGIAMLCLFGGLVALAIFGAIMNPNPTPPASALAVKRPQVGRTHYVYRTGLGCRNLDTTIRWVLLSSTDKKAAGVLADREVRLGRCREFDPSEQVVLEDVQPPKGLAAFICARPKGNPDCWWLTAGFIEW